MTRVEKTSIPRVLTIRNSAPVGMQEKNCHAARFRYRPAGQLTLIRRQIMKRSTGQFILAVSVMALIVLIGSSQSMAASRSATAKADRVEIRINELRTALNITAEQEELWNSVAEVMRDNARTMDTLVTARKNADPMNAVEDFKSYGEISEAQAEGIKKFIPVFETLYNSMSDAQKKSADILFHHQGSHQGHGKSKAKSK
jgi:hypothetical protein